MTRARRQPVVTDPDVYRRVKELREGGARWRDVAQRTGIPEGTLAELRRRAVADGRATKSGGRVTL